VHINDIKLSARRLGYEAVMYSDEQLSEEVLEKAFDEVDFGKLKDCDTNIYLGAVYKSGDYLKVYDERDEI